MPSKIKLGRDQVLTLDGVGLEGVRELEVDIDMATHDITSWNHQWKSVLPIAADATINVLIYWQENYDDFWAKFNQHPPQRMTLGISNVATFWCIPTKVSVKQPIAGVMAWDVELKLYSYE